MSRKETNVQQNMLLACVSLGILISNSDFWFVEIMWFDRNQYKLIPRQYHHHHGACPVSTQYSFFPILVQFSYLNNFTIQTRKWFLFPTNGVLIFQFFRTLNGFVGILFLYYIQMKEIIILFLYGRKNQITILLFNLCNSILFFFFDVSIRSIATKLPSINNKNSRIFFATSYEYCDRACPNYLVIH